MKSSLASAGEFIYQAVGDIDRPVVQIAPIPDSGAWTMGGQGVVSFVDGENSYALSDVTQLPEPTFKKMAYDPQNSELWLVSAKYLYRYEVTTNTWQDFLLKGISDICVFEGNIFLSIGASIRRFDRPLSDFVPLAELPEHYPRIYPSADKIFITTKHKISSLASGEITPLATLIDNEIYSLLPIERNRLILGTSSGLVIVKSNGETKALTTLSGKRIYDVKMWNAKLWAATSDGVYGFTLIEGNNNTVILRQVYSPLESDGATYALAPESDSLWLAGIYGVGVRPMFADGVIKKFVSAERQRDIRAIIPLEQSQGVMVFMQNSVTHLDEDLNTVWVTQLNNRVRSQALLKGEIWLVTDGGVIRINRETGDVMPSDPYLANASPEKIYSDGKSLWLWSDKVGLSRYWPDKALLPYTEFWEQRHRGLMVNSMAAGPNSTVIATNMGLYIAINGQFTYVDSSESIGNIMQVKYINGSYWVLSYTGIYVYSNDLFSPPKKATLPLQEKAQCIFSSKDNVFFGTSKHIAWQSLSDTQHSHFHTAQVPGLQWKDFSPTLCVGNGERFVIGDSKTALLVKADIFNNVRPFSREAFVSSVTLGTRLWRVGLEKDASYLLPANKAISVSLSLLYDSKCPFEYRLWGNGGGEWHTTEAQELNFDHLLPGSYQLQIRERNRIDSLLSFTIEQPLYLRFWGVLVCIFISFLVLFLILVVRNIKLRQQNTYLRKTVHVSIKELEAKKRQSKPEVAIRLRFRQVQP
ncbi:ligand-binding sensor domain-containing protein [Veronia nyctiphanis]|nr:hypothetical protein [Veronia nyctiphanis]